MLTKVFLALGNNRPQILVQLEDCVLDAIVAISEGNSREETMQKLYSKLFSLEKTLTDDEDAQTWFDILMKDSTVPSNLMNSPPSSGSSYLIIKMT